MPGAFLIAGNDAGPVGYRRSIVSAHTLLSRELKSLQTYCVTLVMLMAALTISGCLLKGSAHAQEKPPKPIEDAKKAVETLINHLRGRDMPEGIVKTNGRIEATQVDVAAKYAGRLATVTVDEGDEV